MNLEHQVNWLVSNYPSLFRVRGSASLSRMAVLCHLFCTYGTGYEWCEQGYMRDPSRDEDDFQFGFTESMPDGFYDRLLWMIDVDQGRVGEAIGECSGELAYATVSREGRDGCRTVVFSGSRELAEHLSDTYDLSRPTASHLARILRDQFKACGKTWVELAESSRLVFPGSWPMFDRGIWYWTGDERKPVIPQPDWLQGLKDMAEWAGRGAARSNCESILGIM